MKCKLINYWWQYPKRLVCEGSIVSQEDAEKMASSRNGYGFWEKCNGDIEIEIIATNEPYYGGTSASLEVHFGCNKCGNRYYPERDLPNEYNINVWINNILKEIK